MNPTTGNSDSAGVRTSPQVAGSFTRLPSDPPLAAHGALPEIVFLPRNSAGGACTVRRLTNKLCTPSVS